MAIRVLCLQRRKVLPVEDEPLEVDPAASQLNLHPGMQDVPRRNQVKDAGDRTLLKPLMDGEAMKPAGNPDSAQQRHEQRRLRIALADAVFQDFRCGQIVIRVVPEQDLVFHKGVDGLDPLFLLPELTPSALLDEGCDRRMAEIQKRSFLQ